MTLDSQPLSTEPTTPSPTNLVPMIDALGQRAYASGFTGILRLVESEPGVPHVELQTQDGRTLTSYPTDQVHIRKLWGELIITDAPLKKAKSTKANMYFKY